MLNKADQECSIMPIDMLLCFFTLMCWSAWSLQQSVCVSVPSLTAVQMASRSALLLTRHLADRCLSGSQLLSSKLSKHFKPQQRVAHIVYFDVHTVERRCKAGCSKGKQDRTY